ncbi:MAG TPA: hypothetical protein VMW17_10650 [Candidatus Binatia bacterium]|nr:hypothetical protein [Candidatus Binatia bacterium]
MTPLIRKIGLLVLIAVTVFVTVARPGIRPADAITRALGRGLTRLNLRSEASVEHEPPFSSQPARKPVIVAAPLLGVLLLMLKRRRMALSPLPIRHLKIPPRPTANSQLSD